MTSVRLLSNAVWARAQAEPNVAAYNTPNYTTPAGNQWWIYYPEGGDRTNNRAGGIQSDLRWGFQLVCVGRTIEALMNVVDKADARFHGWTLDSHESTGPFQQEINGDIAKPDPGDPQGARFILTRQYRLTTRS